MNFTELSTFYRKYELIEPVYSNDTKVCGLRTYRSREGLLAALESYFKDADISKITIHDIKQFKTSRFSVSRRGTPRTYASVNRELALLRRLLKLAEQQGWITKTPFGSGLIVEAAETKREQSLSIDEEIRLLDSCSPELKGIVMCALDTGMRRGEIMSLQWEDIDFDKNQITIKALNTKSLRSRSVPISNRLKQELISLSFNKTRRVFAIRNFNGRWYEAMKGANIVDFRFHDLRRTHATKLIKAGIQIAFVSKLLGHTKLETTYRYVGKDSSYLDAAKSALDSYPGMVVQHATACP